MGKFTINRAEAIALVGVVISAIALYVSFEGTKSTNQIASQALETSRQANAIALGTVREPAVLQFTDTSELKRFSFTSTDAIQQELEQVLQLRNDGKKDIDGATLELVGVDGLTYLASDSSQEIHHLPSVNVTITFNSAIQPDGLVLIDIRKPILEYLARLNERVANGKTNYVTGINIVVTPKAVGASAPVGAPSKLSPRDRELITVEFNGDVVTSDVAKKILESETIANRVFSP
jgi:hypothetical protein